MYPVICTVGPLRVYSYGLMLAVGVLVCYFLMSRDARRLGIKPEIISDLIFWTLVGGIAGARIFYVLLNFGYFLKSPLEMIMVHHGGLAWQGGFLLGFLSGFLYTKKAGLSFWRVLDLGAPYLALGQAIGRIGCFLNGCCHGREAAWGVYFPVHGSRLHPTQLYASAALLIVFFILKAKQKSASFNGQIFIYYLLLSSLQRFIIQFFRADYEPVFMGLSIFQIVSLVFLFAASFLDRFLRKRCAKNVPSSAPE